jgi:hypothetical protein
MFWDNIGTIFNAQAVQEQEDRTNMLLKVLVTNNQPTQHKFPEQQRPQLHHSSAELHYSTKVPYTALLFTHLFSNSYTTNMITSLSYLLL